MKLKLLTSLAVIPFIIGCSTSPLAVNLKSGADSVIVKDVKPSNQYEVIAPVSVSHGTGCRDFGYLGTKEDAMKELKNKTVELHGDYAQITTVTTPHLDGGCFKNEYTIMALVYRKAPTRTIQSKVVNTDEEVFTKKMRELKSLLDDGVLSADEYKQQKSKLLNQGFSAK